MTKGRSTQTNQMGNERMKPIQIFFAALSMLVTTNPVFAADPIPEFNSIFQSISQGDYLDPNKRTKLVLSIARYCRTSLAYLPTNTPQETKWLNEESKTSDLTKLGQLFNSKEYARHKIGTTYTSCVATTTQILDAQKAKNTPLEAQLYLVLLEDFTSGDTAFYAQKADIDLSKYGMGLFGLVRSYINRVAATAIGDIK